MFGSRINAAYMSIWIKSMWKITADIRENMWKYISRQGCYWPFQVFQSGLAPELLARWPFLRPRICTWLHTVPRNIAWAKTTVSSRIKCRGWKKYNGFLLSKQCFTKTYLTLFESHKNQLQYLILLFFYGSYRYSNQFEMSCDRKIMDINSIYWNSFGSNKSIVYGSYVDHPKQQEESSVLSFLCFGFIAVGNLHRLAQEVV